MDVVVLNGFPCVLSEPLCAPLICDNVVDRAPEFFGSRELDAVASVYKSAVRRQVSQDKGHSASSCFKSSNPLILFVAGKTKTSAALRASQMLSTRPVKSTFSGAAASTFLAALGKNGHARILPTHTNRKRGSFLAASTKSMMPFRKKTKPIERTSGRSSKAYCALNFIARFSSHS